MAEIYTSSAGKAAVERLYEGVLEHWLLPFERIVIPTGQGDTFVLACGPRSGWPVVLFHGSGTNSSAWIRDVAIWARQYRICAVDMIGEPGFSAPPRPALSSDAYAQWLDEMWSGLGLTQASLAGVSLAGARVIWLDNQGHILPPQTEVIASFLDSVSKASQQFEERPVAS